MPTIIFTRQLERFLEAPCATVEGDKLSEVLAAVFASHQTLRGYVLDDQGALRRHVAVYINGRPASYKSDIIPGDRVVTGNDGHFVFVMGRDAFMVRSRSEFVIERHDETAGFLRLVTGALGADVLDGMDRRPLEAAWGPDSGSLYAGSVAR